MDQKKALQLVKSVRAAYATLDQELAQLEAELEKDLAPETPRKRRNLRAERVANIERMYATKKWLKRPDPGSRRR